MVSSSTAIRQSMTRDEAGRLLGQTMGLVAVTAGAFALGAYLGRNVAYQWGWVFSRGRRRDASQPTRGRRRSGRRLCTTQRSSRCGM
jgi:hypothetical protein